MSIRTERVASLIKHEIASILSREYRDPEFGFVTVTDVQMTADLKIARVAVSILGQSDVRERTMRLLEEEKHRIRGLVGSHVRLKYTPALHFYLDETMERVERINALIKQIHEGDSRHDEPPSES
jgi:ribosome-binding factor A